MFRSRKNPLRVKNQSLSKVDGLFTMVTQCYSQSVINIKYKFYGTKVDFFACLKEANISNLFIIKV